jgi:hypothetical protein
MGCVKSGFLTRKSSRRLKARLIQIAFPPASAIESQVSEICV